MLPPEILVLLGKMAKPYGRLILKITHPLLDAVEAQVVVAREAVEPVSSISSNLPHAITPFSVAGEPGPSLGPLLQPAAAAAGRAQDVVRLWRRGKIKKSPLTFVK